MSAPARRAHHPEGISRAASIVAGLDEKAGFVEVPDQPRIFRLSTPPPDENGQPLRSEPRSPARLEAPIPVLDMLPYAAILAVLSASTAMVAGLLTVLQAVVVVAFAAAVTVASLSMMESQA